MAELEREQIFPAPVKRCFDGLLKVFPVLEMQVKKMDPEMGTIEAHWNPGGTTILIFRVDCKDGGEESTRVVLRYDKNWSSLLSRPNIRTDKTAKAFDDRIFKQMDKVHETLGKYLTDESSLPKITPQVGLDLNHLAWLAGSATSIALRLLAGWAGAVWLPSIASRPDGTATYLKIMAVVSVLIGGVVAGLIKRRNPLKGSAFFEGLIVALANVWLTIFVYKPYITMGCVDWALYGLAGLTAATLASVQTAKKKV